MGKKPVFLRVRKTGFLLPEYVLAYIFVKMLAGPQEDLMALAQKLTKEFSLSYLYNIQVKYHKGQANLIEINTRMSAGIHKSCFTGVNFLYLAIKQLMGENVTAPKDIHWDFQIRTTENYDLVAI